MDKYSILLRKGPGLEKIIGRVISALEIDGWKSDRSGSQDYIIFHTTRSHLMFRNEAEAVKHIRGVLNPNELDYVKLVKIEKGSKNV